MSGGTTMKAVTLWRPWPYTILHATQRKRFEARGWTPHRRQLEPRDWLALHAGQKFDMDGFLAIREIDPTCPAQEDHPTGIVGVVEYLGYFERGREHVVGTPAWRLSQEVQADSGPYVALVDRFGGFSWVFGETVAFEEPVPCSGSQGLWNVPEDVYPRVWEEMRSTEEERVVRND